MSRLSIFLVTILQWNAFANPQNIIFENSNAETSSAAEPPAKCGFSNPGALKFRVTADVNADYGEYPWMVAIIKKSPNTAATEWSQEDYTGAGSIIHPSVVLSAAYWIGKLNADEIKCRAGEWDKSTVSEEYEFQERNVKKIVKHANYFKESLYNDVSLLFLEKPYSFSNAPHIGPVCIGQALPAPNTVCFGMGWGMGTKTKSSNILKKLTVKLLSREDCENKLKETRLGMIFQLHDSLTCVSSDDDNCKGDVGASLVCPFQSDQTRYSIYGMSAYRVNDKGAPCVYVNVPQFYEWIGERMAEEGLNSDSYTYQPAASS